MTDKPIVASIDVKSKYQQALDAYKSFVWSTQSYPVGFPSAYLANPALSSPALTVSTPNSGDIINAANTITGVIKNAAKSFTAIRLCRYVRKLQGDRGKLTVMIDSTQRALFNAQYLTNFTDIETDTGNVIYDTKIDNLLNSIKIQLNNTQNSVVYIETQYCHCLFENSLIDIKYCNNYVLSKDTITITLKDLKNIIDKNPYVSTSSGYCKILNYFENGKKEIHKVNLENFNSLYCTLDHKIFYSENESKPLKDYKIGDDILTYIGKRKFLNAEYFGIANTIDIEVDNENHNFYAEGCLVSNSSCHSSCFSGNTILTIKHNTEIRNITFKELSLELLISNNKIQDYKVDTPTGFKNIKKIYRNGIKSIFLINNNIECTLDHKFVTNIETNKKVQIKKLIGEEVCIKDNQKELITSIKYLNNDLTYDLEVDSEEHNYIINHKYIVSNCHGCLDINKSLIDITYIDNDCEKIETKSLKEVKELLEKYEVYVYAPSQYYKILNYFEKGVNDVYELQLENNLKLYCTLDHKIFYSETESKPLKDYKIGELVKSNKGLSKIKNILFDSKSEIADIEVNNKDHNFYCNGLLVSNSRSRR